MLTRVAFKNFKALRDVALELGRLTVLVGANGSGKTSVLEGIDAICALRTPGPDEGRRPHGRVGAVFNGRWAPERLETATTRAPIVLEVDAGAPLRVEMARALERGEGRWNFSITGGAPEARIGWSSSENSEPPPDFFRQLARIAPQAVRLQLDPEALARPSYIEPGEVPALSRHGEGLASTLAYYAGLRSAALERIEADLQRIIPRAQRLKITPGVVTRQEVEWVQMGSGTVPRHYERSYSGHRLELEMQGMGFLPAEALSEGTLLTLGVLTAIHADGGPTLVLLDDADRGLHPVAQRALFSCLRAVTNVRPELQIVCTTHSPFALDCFELDEVRVLKLDSAGLVHARKLTEHPDWAEWKDHMKAGEFWSFVGEDWVYGEDHAEERPG